MLACSRTQKKKKKKKMNQYIFHYFQPVPATMSAMQAHKANLTKYKPHTSYPTVTSTLRPQMTHSSALPSISSRRGQSPGQNLITLHLPKLTGHKANLVNVLHSIHYRMRRYEPTPTPCPILLPSSLVEACALRHSRTQISTYPRTHISTHPRTHISTETSRGQQKAQGQSMPPTRSIESHARYRRDPHLKPDLPT